jgi:hypothetical protein
MTKQASWLKVSGSHVVSEIIDGEALIIDLVSGSYYTLRDAGADIWALVQEGTQIGGIIDRLTAKYEGDCEEIRLAAMNLLDELADESLIRAEEVEVRERMPASEFSNAAEPGRISFVAPALQKYTDMQELLLLDPIHEVDASGWPKLPDDDPDAGQ